MDIVKKSDEKVKCETVAIIMATYNGEDFINDQIKSILTQTYKNWILYIHDDGSSDSTKQIILDYHKAYPEKVIIIDGIPTGGAKYNFLFLIHHVQGKYVMLCDQDDVWKEEKIEKTILKMHELESKYGESVPFLVFSDLTVVDAELNIVAERMSHFQKLNYHKSKVSDFLAENIITGCTIMANDILINKMSLVSNANDIIMHDWYLALLASYYGIIDYVKEPLMFYRQHGVNSIGAKKMGMHYVIKRIIHEDSVHAALEKTRKQAEFFAKTNNLPSDNIISRYAHINNKNKLERIEFYLRNHINKSGFVRNLGLFLYG